MQLVEVNKLRKSFRGTGVLDDISLQVSSGEVCALLGPNGAGKSTLLQVVAGILQADAGTVRLGGFDLQRERSRALGCVGFVPERTDVPDHVTVREWLSLVASLRRAPLPSAQLIESWGLSDLLHARHGALSLGQKRRVGLVAAQLGSPSVLAMDEPSNGLDEAYTSELVSLIRKHCEKGGAVLCATHDRPLCDRVQARVFPMGAG